jgi:AcrR family transcriptional regulator
MKKTQDNLRARIPEVAMELSAEIGWAHVTLAELAEKLGLSMAELYDHVDDKTDVLVLLGRLIDRKVLENIEVPEAGDLSSTSARDRLFDVMMERYDVLNDYRAGLMTVLESFSFDPKQAVISMPHLCRSMSWMLEAAAIETNGVRGALKVAGLSALYLKVLKTWREDDSTDMGKVMAALDKDLGHVEQAANTFGF